MWNWNPKPTSWFFSLSSNALQKGNLFLGWDPVQRGQVSTWEADFCTQAIKHPWKPIKRCCSQTPEMEVQRKSCLVTGLCLRFRWLRELLNPLRKNFRPLPSDPSPRFPWYLCPSLMGLISSLAQNWWLVSDSKRAPDTGTWREWFNPTSPSSPLADVTRYYLKKKKKSSMFS